MASRTRRREIDGQEIGVGGGGVRQVPAAQDSRRRRLGERGRVRVPRVVVRAIDDAFIAGHRFRGWRRRRFEVHDPPVPAEHDAGAALSAQFGEAFRRERRHPGVEAMRREVDAYRRKAARASPRSACSDARGFRGAPAAARHKRRSRHRRAPTAVHAGTLQSGRSVTPVAGSVRAAHGRVRSSKNSTVEGRRTRQHRTPPPAASGSRPVGEEHRVTKQGIEQPARLNGAEGLASQCLEVGRVQQETRCSWGRAARPPSGSSGWTTGPRKTRLQPE